MGKEGRSISLRKRTGVLCNLPPGLSDGSQRSESRLCSSHHFPIQGHDCCHTGQVCVPGFWGGIARDSGIAGGGGLGQNQSCFTFEQLKVLSVRTSKAERWGKKNSVGMSTEP